MRVRTWTAVEPLELPLTRLALGTLGFSPATRERDYAVLDAWVEAGGTVIDTAHVYEGGGAERVLGQWLRDRPGVRERLVIVTKGAHPDGDRVRGHARRTSRAICATASGASAGRSTSTCSTATTRRPTSARSSTRSTRTGARATSARSASPTGRSRGSRRRTRTPPRAASTGFCCNSPHLSLAVQNEPPWPGCLSAADAESRAWHARTGHAAARLVRAGRRLLRRGPTATSARVYDNAGNRERRARAEQLGRRIGATANAVALAWVLAQPFPTIAVIGPHSVEHLHASLEALDVELSADEARWLNLEA